MNHQDTNTPKCKEQSRDTATATGNHGDVRHGVSDISGGLGAVLSCSLSAVSYQPSAICRQPSAVSEPGVRNTFGGCHAVHSCSLKGCEEVAMCPRRAEPRTPRSPWHSTLQGSAKRYGAYRSRKRRPLQARAVGGRGDSGAALRLAPAILAQALSLPSPPSILSGAPQHSALDVRPVTSNIRPSTFGIRPSACDTRHATFDLQPLPFAFRPSTPNLQSVIVNPNAPQLASQHQ